MIRESPNSPPSVIELALIRVVEGLSDIVERACAFSASRRPGKTAKSEPVRERAMSKSA